MDIRFQLLLLCLTLVTSAICVGINSIVQYFENKGVVNRFIFWLSGTITPLVVYSLPFISSIVEGRWNFFGCQDWSHLNLSLALIYAILGIIIQYADYKVSSDS